MTDEHHEMKRRTQKGLVQVKPKRSALARLGISIPAEAMDEARGEPRHEARPPTGPLIEGPFISALAVTPGLTPEGGALCVGDLDGRILVYTSEDGKLRHRLRGPGGAVTRLLLSANGARLYAGGADGWVFALELASGEGRELSGRLGAPVTGLAWIGDEGVLAASGLEGYTRFWTETGQTLGGWEAGEPVLDLVGAPDGKRLYSAEVDGTVKLRDPGDGAVRDSHDTGDGGVRTLALSPEGGVLYDASDGGGIGIKPAGVARRSVRGPDTALALAVGPQALYAAFPEGGIQVLDPVTGEHRHTLPGDGKSILALAADANGKLFAGGMGRTVEVWNSGAGKAEERHLATLHPRESGHLWTTPPDRGAAGGRLWAAGKATDELTVYAVDKAGKRRRDLPLGSRERDDYLGRHNHEHLVMHRINDWSRYQGDLDHIDPPVEPDGYLIHEQITCLTHEKGGNGP